jgi:hypothetical protein
MITPDDADDPSTCLGRADSPLCLMKTLLACSMLGHKELCKAEWWPADIPDWLIPDDLVWDRVIYRIVGARRARARDIPEDLWMKGAADKVRVGDVLLLAYIAQCSTFTGPCWADDESSPQHLYFRLVGDHWRLVAIHRPL